MKRPSLPILAFGCCGLIWGSTFLVIRIGNDSLPALWACTLRLGLAAILLNLILLGTGQRWPKGEALKAAALYGFWEFGFGMSLLYWGERVVPSGLAAVLFAICPLAAVFEARLLGMEEISSRKLLGAVMALIGVAVIFWKEVVSGGSPIGLVTILLAACTAPIAPLMLQRAPAQGAVGANAVGALVGFPFSLMASVVLGERRTIPSSLGQVLPVVYLAILGSVVAFVTFAWLTKHWKTTSVAFLGVVIPVIALILGAVVRHESFGAESLAGAAIVIFAVVVALRGPEAGSLRASVAEGQF